MLWTKKDIIFEDQDIIAVYKPATMPVESRRIDVMTLERQVKNLIARRDGVKGNIYLATINRIDQVVEGIVLFAKNKKAAANLSKQLQQKKIEKVYVAVTNGKVIEKTQRLHNYMVKEEKGNFSRIAKPDEKDAKEAILSYEVIDCDEKGNTLLKIHLETGRHHQIRVQMAAAGMPLVNDFKYGSSLENTEAKNFETKNAEANARSGGRRIPGGNSYVALCAKELTFYHPRTNQVMHLEVKPRGKVYETFRGQL